MPDEQDETSTALRHVRIGLMMSHPYLATAVARLPLVDATDREWCATFATDGFTIYFNRDFVRTLSEAGLMFVMAHELIHCIVGHLDRRGERDPFLWNIASDYATNAMLVAHGFQAPAVALLDARFKNDSAERIYDELLKSSTPRGLGSGRQGGSGAGAGSTTKPTCSEVKVRTADGAVQRLRRDACERQVGIDAHLDAEGAAAGDLRPPSFPSESERRSLRKELVQAAATSAGSIAGHWLSELKAATVSPVAWQSLLAQFLSGLRRSDYRLFPPHRKHIHRGLYLPALGVPGPQHLVVAVDTSGSMTPSLLDRVFAQIDHMRAATECTITLLQFDVRIQSVVIIEPWDSLRTLDLINNSAVGGGGTDLCAPFRWVDDQYRLHSPHMDALLIMTDGFGPVPSTAPPYPVLWAIAANGRNRCSFGAEVLLPNS